MPDDIEEVTIYYTQDRFWKLRLTPYGKRNYFRFEDRTEELFKQSVQAQNANEAAALQKQAEQARQQDELAQNIANLGDAIANAINSEYILKVTNNGKTIASEGVEGNYFDIINYAIFDLIHYEN